jgi:predicted DNA-binding transcriptional regulator AlpA
MQFAIKDIVKDNKAHFSFYRSGNMFYTVTVNGTKWIDQLEKESRVLRARDVAKLFQVTPQHVYKMAAGGRLPSFRLLGQFVSIPMNWRTGFEKRSQFLIGWKRATNCVAAHSSQLRCLKAMLSLDRMGAKSHHPNCSQFKILVTHGQVIQRRSRSSVRIL